MTTGGGNPRNVSRAVSSIEYIVFVRDEAGTGGGHPVQHIVSLMDGCSGFYWINWEFYGTLIRWCLRQIVVVVLFVCVVEIKGVLFSELEHNFTKYF